MPLSPELQKLCVPEDEVLLITKLTMLLYEIKVLKSKVKIVGDSEALQSLLKAKIKEADDITVRLAEKLISPHKTL